MATLKTVQFRVTLLLFCSYVGTSGCSRTAELSYVPSSEAKELKPELQNQITAILETHCGTQKTPKLLGNDKFDARRLAHGREVYLSRCVQCHGVSGDGNGAAAKTLYPRPRDYRRGFFKFTSTPYGSKPRAEDLVRTVKIGIPGTSMPSFALLPKADIDAVVDYVIALTHRGELEFQLALEAQADDAIDPDHVTEMIGDIVEAWTRSESSIVHPMTSEPKFSQENVIAGKKAFLSRGCSKCHGEDGRGQTPDNLRGDLKDSWGHVTRAADLTSGMLHGGREPLDVYRRIFSGINGTPMPAFQSSLAQEPETVWNLVAYVLHLSNERRRGTIPEAGTASLPTAYSTTASSTPTAK